MSPSTQVLVYLSTASTVLVPGLDILIGKYLDLYLMVKVFCTWQVLPSKHAYVGPTLDIGNAIVWVISTLDQRWINY